MISSLEDAQNWYSAVKRLVSMMDRIARRYWNEEFEDKTLKETIHKDDRFRMVEAAEIQNLASRVMDDLDDLAVLLLFSVFEADVRDRIGREIERELATLPKHPLLIKSVDDLRQRVESGSFGQLTEAYRKELGGDLTLVDQVRRYRNWVAHGRRADKPSNMDPRDALQRLNDFLDHLNHDAAARAAQLLADSGAVGEE